jgi:carboxymethylenebutenolidase
LDLAAALKCPLLGLYGGADDSIDIADVREAAARAKTAGQVVQVEVLPGAPHGFHADYRATYHKEAAEKAWGEALAWFRAHGVG